MRIIFVNKGPVGSHFKSGLVVISSSVICNFPSLRYPDSLKSLITSLLI